jgi:hypothetical protein
MDGDSRIARTARFELSGGLGLERRQSLDPVYSPPVRARSNSAVGYGLTGTYRLDQSRSEDTRSIAENAVRNGNIAKDRNAQSDLENKLQAPDEITIEVRGSQITLASSNASQITFTADGRDRTENLSNGKTLRVRSILRGQELTVSSLGGDTITPSLSSRLKTATRCASRAALRPNICAKQFSPKASMKKSIRRRDSETIPVTATTRIQSNDQQDEQSDYPTMGSGERAVLSCRTERF